jgi:hypothetical protein
LLRNEAAAVQGRLAQNQSAAPETANRSAKLAPPSAEGSKQEAINPGQAVPTGDAG